MTARPILIAFLLALTSFTVTAKDKKDQEEVPVIIVKDSATGTYAFEQVVEVPDVKKEELYSRAKTWVTVNVKSGDNNNVFDDKEGTIINTGSLKFGGKKAFRWAVKDGVFDFKLQLQFKDGRFKIHIGNITAFINDIARGERTMAYAELDSDKAAAYSRDQINIKLAAFIAALEDAIKAKPAKSDW